MAQCLIHSGCSGNAEMSKWMYKQPIFPQNNGIASWKFDPVFNIWELSGLLTTVFTISASHAGISELSPW